MSNQFRHKVAASKKQNSDWKGRIWGSNIFSILLIILLIASFVKVGKEIMLRLEINREINTLQAQLGDLEDRKDKMDKFISYLQTDEYIEKQARLELNLSKPGEKQVNLIGIENSDNNFKNDNRPNLEKWYNYFFN